MNNDFLSPLILGADSFQLAGDGDQAAVNSTQLINPNRTGMLVDEIRLGLYDDNTNNGIDLTTTQVSLLLGSVPLTNGFIPARSFMPVYTQFPFDGTISWRLARPMYVPPNVQLSAFFKRKLPFAAWAAGNNPGISTTAFFNFAIAGRSMPSGMAPPDKINVPWACATSVYAATVPFLSADSDIGNPFDEPLNVDYFSGWQQATGGTVIPTHVTFQATLSNGKVLARDPTPFLALFPPDRPVLKMRALLQPKEFVSVVLDLPQPTATYTNLIFTTIGMTGWREIQAPLGVLP